MLGKVTNDIVTWGQLLIKLNYGQVHQHEPGPPLLMRLRKEDPLNQGKLFWLVAVWCISKIYSNILVKVEETLGLC